MKKSFIGKNTASFNTPGIDKKSNYNIVAITENDKNVAKKSEKENLNVYYGMLAYIGDHFRENINTTVVAQECFISRGYASKVFFKHAQKHMKEYIDQLRINHANKLLEQNISIYNVASECGFSCVRTFNNVYKKVMGITPTQYIESKTKLAEKEETK